MQANLYELKALTLQVTYSASSIDGRPQLTYKKGATPRTFRGDELRQEEHEIGTLVSVTLRSVPDLKTLVFTLVIPQVNVPETGTKVNIRTIAAETTIFTTIGGPNLVEGAVQKYKTYALRGSARHVDF